ncbi:invasion associated locus B family protein [Rhizobium sp.]|uniref:invasion associated locus B family protein n=1 Tax=Rhizobium sp. TaxID=391 RepID=UPI002EF11F61
MQQQYSIKPSEVVLPEGVAPGQYRRIIRPFNNWTLICDENLKKKQRVCNITQTIVDARGAMAFSWSLAGTSNGNPIMIIRVPASVGKGNPVQISFSSQKNPVNAKTEDCDQTVCLILQPVGPVLREQINKQVDVRITYANPANGNDPIVIGTTLKGLPTALAAIK